MTEEKLQAIYDTARTMYDTARANYNFNPIIASSDVREALVAKGVQITDREVQEGYWILEQAGRVLLGNPEIMGNHDKVPFICAFWLGK